MFPWHSYHRRSFLLVHFFGQQKLANRNFACIWGFRHFSRARYRNQQQICTLGQERPKDVFITQWAFQLPCLCCTTNSVGSMRSAPGSWSITWFVQSVLMPRLATRCYGQSTLSKQTQHAFIGLWKCWLTVGERVMECSTTQSTQAELFMGEGAHLCYDPWLNDSEDGI